MSRTKKLALVIVTTLILILSSALVVIAQQPRQDILPAAGPYTASQDEITLSQLYNRVVPSVVNINIAIGQQGVGGGSGFVLDTNGHIVTNNHVVANASYVQVTFQNGLAVEAQIVGTDPDSDLAVIRVDPNGLNLQPLPLADSDQVFVGQDSLAIGSPFGQDFTLTTGIVSALNRQLDADSNFTIPDVIQTDAAINPGNSGGPLLDLQGRVIGVNSAILTSTGTGSGVGFAIPSNQVRRVAPYLIAQGSYEHSWLGISGSSVAPDQRQAGNLPADLVGVMVVSVTPNGPAGKAGLQGTDQGINTPLGILPVGGDIITAINGTPVGSMSDLISYLGRETRPGDTVTLTIYRGGTGQVAVQLAARPNFGAQ